MTLTFTIDAVDGGFQGRIRREGSIQAWNVTSVLPTEDAVTSVIATAIYYGAQLVWGGVRWGEGAWG
jgi:hypothetical protein